MPAPLFYFYSNMLVSCLNDVVSLGLCEDETSTSGLTLMNAPGMSPLNGNKIATEQYGTGVAMFNAKKETAIITVRNDFIGVLQANNIASTLTERLYDTAYFNTTEDTGTYDGYRGQVLKGRTTRGGLRKLKIKKIQCFPLVSGDGQILITDYNNGIEISTYVDVTFVANQLNTFNIEYTAQNHTILVRVDNTTIHFGSSVITCKDGCSGSKNPCGSAQGYDGDGAVRSNGYGLNIQFVCECDYEALMCNFSRAFMGELIWLKWQEMVYEEMYKSNRWNSWTTYNREDIQKYYLPELQGKYTSKFSAMIEGGLFEMLKQYQDECLNCRGIVVMTNI